MKKFLLIILACALVGCEKAPKNGYLDGMWQLTCIEEFGANDGAPSTFHNQKDRFWNFQLNLMQLGSRLYFSHFKRDGSSLTIERLARQSKNETASDNDEWLTEKDTADIAAIREYGFFSLPPTTFAVEQIDDDAMVLRSGEARLTFRKY
ncbi:MAG: lipocalin-like domain-containing protein [Bacteroidaceae bacterium]|nr:lipocalin-like domain-containing protein [Bacteroidaceae bacterium]